ncbi:uncharacterized protein F4812DRAFT_2696 [Daldinia caldariorum]|uniref:uncharacterized protein n=1 Tax=Daldinia caldariorum TaxID=326644 RepID=UPI002007E92E|nr:uncharacterized protein F4812DRAFT_2696 [Daldinia caldariorum]KAI1472212.1 hypothetical protein F4812DRAFT_2696 [Daldinia caldariorum]
MFFFCLTLFIILSIPVWNGLLLSWLGTIVVTYLLPEHQICIEQRRLPLPRIRRLPMYYLEELRNVFTTLTPSYVEYIPSAGWVPT